MVKKDSVLNKLEKQVVDLENRVQKIESIFHLGSNILTTPYLPTDSIGNIDIEAIYKKAVKIVQKYDRASTSLIQRKLSIRYLVASRLFDLMEERGIIGPADGSKPRVVYKERKRK